MQGLDPQGSMSKLNITSATVVKTGFGVCCNISVIVAGSGNGTVNDCATTGAAAVANQMLTIPQTLGPLASVPGFPYFNGLCIVPGTGQTIAVAYS